MAFVGQPDVVIVVAAGLVLLLFFLLRRIAFSRSMRPFSLACNTFVLDA